MRKFIDDNWTLLCMLIGFIIMCIFRNTSPIGEGIGFLFFGIGFYGSLNED